MNSTEKDNVKQLRIFVIDDTDMMRMLVRQFLERNDKTLIVGEASDSDEAMKMVKETNPDIVLLDMNLPGISGVEVARKIKSILPTTRIYLFSAYEVSDYREMDLDLPIEGFIQKSDLKSELQEMIRKELERKKR